MGFLGVYKAIYDYAPQAEGELEVSEGDVLYVLEKDEDDWWKAKKKASADDDDEPVGLVPSNYVEEVDPSSHARALYEYTRQTDEELSFPEDAQLTVFDTSDPDWILVGFEGDYGFVPSNYIELQNGEAQREAEEEAVPSPPALPSRVPAAAASPAVASPPLPTRNVPSEPSSPAASGPAAALANVLGGRSISASHAPPPLAVPPRPQYVSDDSEEDARSPPLPARHRTESATSAEQAYRSPPPESRDRDNYEASPQTPTISPGGFHLYNVNEMVSVMGKRKKLPTTLGINLKTGKILVAPERTQDGETQEWTADRMTHYSREGKHVFIDFVRKSKSYDFHAGAKDTAEEIVGALGELAGAVKAEGLREVILAGTGQTQRKGQILYDFMAQGQDEVSVAAGDEVIILDDSRSQDWWQVRRVKNGKEGVVPSEYVEVTGDAGPAAAAPSQSGLNAGRSTVEQNRIEEARLTKEAVKAAQREEQRERDNRASEVGPGMRLPERNSSLSANDSGNREGQQRGKRENGRAEASSSTSNSSRSKSKPDAAKVRTWTDRSKSFTVEAQFLGMKDGKLNLHKMNGVKIAVPVAKMSVEDIEYVENYMGISLDDDKPLSEVKRKAESSKAGESSIAPPRQSSSSNARVGASVEPKKSEYDWFQFFLSCDVAVGLCERYAQAFSRESMDESVLPDVDASVLRNLGLREGDIIKVMRFLDNKYGRTKKGKEDGDASGGLFSGPGGTLRNNTRKGRPAPAVQTSDVVDAKAFSQQKDAPASTGPASPSSDTPPPLPAAAAAAAAAAKPSSGFDDDAWDVKPSKTKTPEPAPQPAARAPEPVAAPAPAPTPAAVDAAPPPPPKPQQPLTGSMAELSLLSQPLEPQRTQPVAPPALQMPPPVVQQPPPQPVAAQSQIPQPTGATPSFFNGMPPPNVNGQQFGQVSQQAIARQRPMPPQYTQGQSSLAPPPPPSRPLSAPQSAQPSQFAPPPLQPQMTGNPNMYQTQIAAPGQSLNDINQARLQQQYAQQMQASMMPQPTGIPFQGGFPQQQQPQQTGFAPNQFPQPTGFNGIPQQLPQQQMQSPFADPRQQQFSPVQAQPTGFPGLYNPQQQQQNFGGVGMPQGNVNSFLPPAMEPQRTGMPSMQQPPMQPQATGMGFSQGFGNAGMGIPQQQGGGMQPPLQPLQPQQTGPAPPVRFGVEPKKLAPQPTGRRANLAHATPQNPFGF